MVNWERHKPDPMMVLFIVMGIALAVVGLLVLTGGPFPPDAGKNAGEMNQLVCSAIPLGVAILLIGLAAGLFPQGPERL